MSIKLKELQDIAEAKSREYMLDRDYSCIHSTLLAINDALKTVDSVNYAEPALLKATSPLAAGFGAWEAPCGAASAGSIAIGLKYGTSSPGDEATITNAMRRSREWLQWFKYRKFGSYNCFDIRGTPAQPERCTNFVVEASKRLVDILTEGNPKVTR